MKLGLLIFSLVAILTVACSDGAPPASPLVILPADEAPHDAGIEWWYFNGLFTDDQDREYSYHFVTFQSRATGTAVPHLLQGSLGDHSAGEHLTGERVFLASLDEDAVGIKIEVDGWEMQGDGEFYSMEFDLGDFYLDLKAIPSRPPILHQGTGLVGLGPAGDTFYYSRTRLDLSGSITVDGEQRAINGLAWMDHQWGNDISQQVGWDWVSVQLDDGSDLMAVLVWDPSDRTPFAGYGTLISPDGSVVTVEQKDVSITSTDTWISPETGITYPSGWKVAVSSLELNLELEPVLLNAEFAGSRFTPAAYWEGEVRVSGTRQGRPVGGRGFVELVGYDPQQLEPTPAP